MATDEIVLRVPTFADPLIYPHSKFNFLQDYLETDTKTTSEAATQVTARINASDYTFNSIRDIAGQVANLWATILVLAHQIPYDHTWQERLIELLLAIRGLPPPSHLNTDAWRYGGNAPLWHGLPTLGQTIYEAENDRGLLINYDEFHDSGGPLLTREEWVNLNSFLARIAEAGIMALGPTTGRSLCTLVLDKDMETTRLNDNVPVAAVWMIYAEYSMYDVMNNEKGDADNWLSLRERFSELCRDQSLRRNTQDWAMGAVEAMDRIRQ